jgi:cobalamin biosynthesis Mg chelatase CobN
MSPPLRCFDEQSQSEESSRQGDISLSSEVSSAPRSDAPCTLDHVNEHSKAEAQERKIAGQESRGVGVLKLVVVVFISITAVIVVTGTYMFLRESTRQEYNDAVSSIMTSTAFLDLNVNVLSNVAE